MGAILYKGQQYTISGGGSSGGGGGSTVTITPTVSSGVKIADYTIDGVAGALYVPSEDSGITLFKNGTWQNQNICGITPYRGSISGNDLVFSGENAGISVTSVSGMSSYSTYAIAFKMTSTSGVAIQAGRCDPSGNLNDIINFGIDRITYTNDSLPSGNMEIELDSYSNLEGVYFGGGYGVSTVSYSISEIVLLNKGSKRIYD